MMDDGPACAAGNARGLPGPDAGAPAAPPAASRIRLLGVPVDVVTRDHLWQRIDRACHGRTSLHIATTSVHFVSLARRRPDFAAVLAGDCELSLADGRLLQWVTRLCGPDAPEQITGHDVFAYVIERAAVEGWRVFLLGGSPGRAHELAQRLRALHPALTVDATDGGRFDDTGRHQDPGLIDVIRRFDPQVLFVALGAPKQELWIARHRAQLAPCVMVGVGGVFDTAVGRLPRAPRWMQRAGLESMFQLLVAPRRYARRYLIEDPPTLARLVAAAIRDRVRKPRSRARHA